MTVPYVRRSHIHIHRRQRHRVRVCVCVIFISAAACTGPLVRLILVTKLRPYRLIEFRKTEIIVSCCVSAFAPSRSSRGRGKPLFGYWFYFRK